MKKIYHVFILDIWNNITEIGHFRNLKDAIPEINKMIDKEEWELKPGDLVEYPSTFGTVFDTCLYDILSSRLSPEELERLEDDETASFQIRGFIYDADMFKEYINKVLEDKKEED